MALNTIVYCQPCQLSNMVYYHPIFQLGNGVFCGFLKNFILKLKVKDQGRKISGAGFDIKSNYSTVIFT